MFDPSVKILMKFSIKGSVGKSSSDPSNPTKSQSEQEDLLCFRVLKKVVKRVVYDHTDLMQCDH